MKNTSIISLILLLLSLLFGISFSGCGYRGNGNVTVEKRQLGSFKTVVIDQEGGMNGLTFGENRMSTIELKLVHDTAEYASIEYDENLMHHIKTETVNERLIIRTGKPLYSKRNIHVNIHYKHIEHIEASSLVDIVFANPYHGKTLSLNLSGASDLTGGIFADELLLDVSGAADITLSGKLRKLQGDLSGASDIQAYGLVTDTCMLNISGAGDAEVHVLNFLKVDVSGSATVNYKGNPQVVKEISGAGDVEKAEADSLSQ